jgi:hypothetical protein
MFVRVTSYRSPSLSISPAGSDFGALAWKKLSDPEKNVIHAGMARLNQQCRGKSTARRHTGKYERLFNVVGVSLPRRDSRGLLRSVVQHPPHLSRVQIGCATGCRGGSESASDAMGASMTGEGEVSPSHGHRHPSSDVVAECHGIQESSATDAEQLPRAAGTTAQPG